MLTQYNATHDKAIAGQPIGDWRESRPMSLPWLDQITTVTTANGAGTDDWVITITDDESGQEYEVTAAGSGTEATLDANMEAAFAAHAKLPSLFDLEVTSTSDVVATFTAKHANRSYTFAATGGTGANTIANTQDPGGDGLEFGLMVAQGTGDKEFRAMGASDDARDCVGILFRTEANHFHSLENDSASAVDASERGKCYSIMEKGRLWVEVEEDVTPASRVWVRRAATSSVGTPGGFRASPAGGAETATITVIADQQLYRVKASMVIDGVLRDLEFEYRPTDATTTTDVAIDGLEAAAAAAITAQGFDAHVTASSASAAATMTLTTEAGVVFDHVDGTAFNLDSAAEALTVAITGTDADAIDVSAFCRYESTASAGGLAELRINL